MKHVISVFLMMLIALSSNSQTDILKTVTVDNVGWKRIARFDGLNGRGYADVTLMTQGGASMPRVANISWFKGWGNHYGGLNVVSIGDYEHWSNVRITYDGTKSYLEVYFTNSIPQLKVYMNQFAWPSGDIIDGVLPNGGDTVIVSAKFGKVNFGEDDLYLDNNGNVGIGTTAPDERLAVNGNIHAKEVRVDLTGWSDFVFAKDYDLPTLQEVEQHIKDKGHLKDVPSVKEVEASGIMLGDMNAKLLQKIEELTLYTIEQEKKLDLQENQIKEQSKNNIDLNNRLLKLEQLLSNQQQTTNN